jgi:uncharacterized membrane-anchored protein YhcB (DUF1043 family)
MALEHYSEHAANDRSQQIIGLLSELSERLKRAETERDLVKREMLTIRECIQDLNTQSDQTQKAILAIENKYDGTETIVEGAMRRLGNMEESVDKQSTELLAILRKIEDRFDAYDREYKTHAASIAHYGDTLDRFDKKLEKLLSDKTRLARKIDTLEFQMADLDDRDAPQRPATRRDPPSYAYTPAYEEAEEEPHESAATPSTITQDTRVFPTEHVSNTNALSKPAQVNWGTSSTRAARVWQYGAVAVFIVLAGVIGFAVYTTVQKNAVSPPQKETAADLQNKDDDGTKTVTRTLPIPTETQYFSTTIRAQIDTQIVAARTLEDQSVSALMTAPSADRPDISTQIKPDIKLPRTIAAIESKAFDGNAEAQHDMGALYTSGTSGVKTDYARANAWFTQSARNGIANARYNLGVLAQQGLGMKKDMDQALSWYRTAAVLGHPEARYNLGIAYVEGIGVAYNPAMAAGYFEQSARDGVIEAAYNLGLILENGLIEQPRPYEGLFWYKLAMDGGSQNGARSFARLSASLGITPEDWQKLYTAMLSERPDLKQLADSRETRALPIQSPTSTVRVHNMGLTTGGNTAPRLTPPPAPAQLDNVDDIAAAMSPPPVTKKILPEPSQDNATNRQMVARIQTMLSDEGFYTGRPDGLYGPGTAKAIRAYQKKYNLPVDGKANTTLMAQMLAKRLADKVEPAGEE